MNYEEKFVEVLRIDQIQIDGGTQMRAGLHEPTVLEYLEAMSLFGWSDFPPIIAYYDGADYWLADGFHRVEAYCRATAQVEQPADKIPADVRAGTRRDAILYAAAANAQHGLRRTNADKRRAVEALLRDEEWSQWSDREIARRCDVHNSFVSRLRGELSVDKRQITERTVQRGGVTFTQNTANIGTTRKQEPEQATEPTPQESEPPQPAPEPEPTPRQPRTQREPEPAAPTLPDAVTIHHADARMLASLVTEPVQLVVTSPPYNVGIDYATHDDAMSDDDYQDLLYDVFGQCWQVMEDGARIAVVVPFGVGRNPWTPVLPTIYSLLKATGFTLRGQIIWDKNTTGNRTSWGSFRLSSNPAIRDTTEAIIVAHKGDGNLSIPEKWRGVDAKGTYTGALSDSDYFMELAQDHWVVAPESAQRVGHPAPFPVELAKRLIDFYAYPGAHVLDPFGGSGTTAIAAMRAGCRATLVEIDEGYCRLAKGRLTQ